MSDTHDGNRRFQRFCIVGLGSHARTRLIPALVANGQTIVGLVTSRAPDGLPSAQIFRRLDDALVALPPDTVFVIATPPALHFDQVMATIAASRDLIVEKPAFVTERQAIEASAQAARQGSALIEAFMHRHTELYRRLLATWAAERSLIQAINITFLIPQMPLGTFRQGEALACSSLYDVGCYPLSLLCDLRLALNELQLETVEHPGDCDREALRLGGMLDNKHVEIRVGVGSNYVNAVSLTTQGGQMKTFSPFFRGPRGDKIISMRSAENTSEEVLSDANAFEAMFAVSRQTWMDGQNERLRQMTTVTAALERLGEALAKARQTLAPPIHPLSRAR